MEYSDKNEHLNDDQLENSNNSIESPKDDSEAVDEHGVSSKPEPEAEPDVNLAQTDSSETDRSDAAPLNPAPEDLTSPESVAASKGDSNLDENSELSAEEIIEDENEKASSEPAVDESEHEEKKDIKRRKKIKIDVEESHEGHKEEKVNYELLSKEDLVKVLDDILNKKTYDQWRREVDEINAVYEKKVEEELAEKKKHFLEEGGLEQDFKPVEDPAEKQMAELQDKIKTLKADFNKQLEQTKEENLIKKQEILEEFRILMEGQEGFENTFRKFKQLQNKWFDAGIVPKQNVRDLWNSYNYFVDKFNDYVNINRELRAMDLKKNLELKTKLCEKAEALSAEPNISNAFKTLQKYHTQWREIGPVPREDKDVIWNRFKAATAEINKAHQNFQVELKDSLVENLEHKKQLCEKAEAISVLEPKNHGEWMQITDDLLAIQKEWKTIGYAPKKDNNVIYARFRKACDIFFEKKAAFYSETFEHQKENLEKKKQIIELARELKDSTDWKTTTDKLIELQKEWKKVGPVPRKESDRLWKQFRSACDQFFSKKSEFYSGKNESYEDNLKAKQDLIAEMKAFKPAGKKESIEAMEEFQNKYNSIGFVPVEQKDRIRDEFQAAQDSLIDSVKTNDTEKDLIRYRVRIASIINNPRSDNKLRFERDKMMNKLQQLRTDIGVWENNIGFFKQTKSSEGMISDFSDKIDEAKSRIEMLENKIQIIDELEDGK